MRGKHGWLLLLGMLVACAGPTDDSTIAGGNPGSGSGGASGVGGTKGDPGVDAGSGAKAGAGSTCELDQDCDPAHVCNIEGGVCVPGGGCGQQEFALESRISDLFIALDRSCSMQHGTPTKWSVAVTAVQKLVSKFSGKIRFGLALFPDLDESSCSQGDSQTLVELAEQTESQITNVLHLPLAQPGVYGACDTNIDSAIEQLSQQKELLASEAGFGLLLTDGKQNDCADAGGFAGTVSTLKALASKDVKTFIVGFKGGVDPAAMNAFAEAGGAAKSGSESYYQADSAAELEAALDSIGGTISDCSFTLTETPESPDLLFAFLNDQAVPRDPSHQHGWDYDAKTNSVEFYGADCDKLKSGQVSDVDVVFGCNQPSPH